MTSLVPGQIGQLHDDVILLQSISIRKQERGEYLVAVIKGTVSRYSACTKLWTGCPEIKRCEESKRTLKNPFASRLAEFNTTLKLLRITDQ